MIRTNIYLTEQERQEIDVLASSTGRTQSEIIREAIDVYLDQHRRSIIFQAAGMWKDREDSPDFQNIRASFDRN